MTAAPTQPRDRVQVVWTTAIGGHVDHAVTADDLATGLESPRLRGRRWRVWPTVSARAAGGQSRRDMHVVRPAAPGGRADPLPR